MYIFKSNPKFIPACLKQKITPVSRCSYLHLLIIFSLTAAWITLSLTLSAKLHAMEIETSNGMVSGSFDTTVSTGAAWRVEKRDEDLVGVYNGGNASHVNGDDGDLNYDRGVISQLSRVTHELDLNYLNFSFFGRMNYFYDTVNANKDELSGDAKAQVGADVDILDAYINGDFHVEDHPLNVRLGNQVLSWGESTFIQNGVNIISPIDVTKLRSPGSELRDALIPVPMISASFGILENVSMEGFYQFAYENTEIDPPGTYFSASDFVGNGGETLWLGPEGAPGAGIPRDNRDARDDGQFGIAIHTVAHPLNDTEFGLFYINYHSRLPVISVKTGTQDGASNGDYPGSMRYIVEYPEDIHVVGASFSTMLKESGVALQGEYSFRPNMPLQLDDGELLSAGFTPLNAIAGTGYTSQLGAHNFSDEIQGFKTHKVGQAQATASKVFGPNNPFRAANIWVMGEAGITHVYNLESKGSRRYDGPEASAADALSSGYRLLAKMDYPNAIGAVQLSPRLAFSHDVFGISPGPGGNFIEGRKAVTVGLGGSFLERWQADVDYTSYFGAGDLNLLHDRDFITMNVKYFF